MAGFWDDEEKLRTDTGKFFGKRRAQQKHADSRSEGPLSEISNTGKFDAQQPKVQVQSTSNSGPLSAEVKENRDRTPPSSAFTMKSNLLASTAQKSSTAHIKNSYPALPFSQIGSSTATKQAVQQPRPALSSSWGSSWSSASADLARSQ